MAQSRIKERHLTQIKDDSNKIKETQDQMLFTALIEEYLMGAMKGRTLLEANFIKIK